MLWRSPAALVVIALTLLATLTVLSAQAPTPVACWGNDEQGVMLDARPAQRIPGQPVIVADVESARTVHAARAYACALDERGTVACWGDAPGRGSADHDHAAKAVPGLVDAQSMSAGSRHACAVRATGTVYCWGDNRQGQLGSDSPVASSPNSSVEVRGDRKVVAVAAGDGHSCALRQDGQVQCWGDDTHGQRGTGGPLSVVRGLSDAKAIAVGADHSCALRRSGTVVCWGDNRMGQVGNGSGAAELEQPVRLPEAVRGLSGVVELSAGRSHTCARIQGGKIWCWGSNKNQQLGSGTLSDVWTTPVPTRGVQGLTGISAGHENSCALLRGQAYCWGDVKAGLLGPKSSAIAGTPARAPVADAVQVSAGIDFACARLRSGMVSCWGADENGQLGGGRSRYIPTPSRVPGL